MDQHQTLSRQMQTLRRFIKREVSDVVAAFQSFCGAAGVRADKGAPHHEFGISDGQRAIDPDRPNPRAILDSSALQNNFGSAHRRGETRRAALANQLWELWTRVVV